MNALRGRAPSVHQRGLSLVELMVAMLVSLVLLGGVIQIYISSSQTNRLQEASSRLQENGRFAIEFIARGLREAGNGGCRNISQIAPNIISDFVESEFGDTLEAEDAIIGANDVPAGNAWNASEGTDAIRVLGATSSGAALSGNTNPNNSNVQVKRNANDWEDGDILLIADCQQADIFTATTVSNANSPNANVAIAHANGNTPNKLSNEYDESAEVISFADTTFFVRDTGDTAQDGKRLRGLYRERNDESAQELLRGIEDLQITYGLDSDADGNVDEYVDASPGTAWEEVLAVRVEMLFASEEPNLLAEPQPYYFAGQTVDDDALIGDRRLRRVFATTITLRNRAP